MQMFLSWSGAQSKAIAETLAEWVSNVIQAVDPWISSETAKGVSWNAEVAGRLEQSKVGIVCLTRDNLNAPWILFEVGALSKTKDAHVCTFLLDLAPTDVVPPLSQFQHTIREKEDIRRLLQAINGAVQKNGERHLDDARFNKAFETNWPELEQSLARIASEGPSAQPTHRPEREILEEILEVVRGQERRLASIERDQNRAFWEDTITSALEKRASRLSVPPRRIKRTRIVVTNPDPQDTPPDEDQT